MPPPGVLGCRSRRQPRPRCQRQRSGGPAAAGTRQSGACTSRTTQCSVSGQVWLNVRDSNPAFSGSPPTPREHSLDAEHIRRVCRLLDAPRSQIVAHAALLSRLVHLPTQQQQGSTAQHGTAASAARVLHTRVCTRPAGCAPVVLPAHPRGVCEESAAPVVDKHLSLAQVGTDFRRVLCSHGMHAQETTRTGPGEQRALSRGQLRLCAQLNCTAHDSLLTLRGVLYTTATRVGFCAAL